MNICPNLVPDVSDADFEKPEAQPESEGVKRVEEIQQRMSYGVILKADKDFLIERALLSFKTV